MHPVEGSCDGGEVRLLDTAVFLFRFSRSTLHRAQLVFRECALFRCHLMTLFIRFKYLVYGGSAEPYKVQIRRPRSSRQSRRQFRDLAG